MQERRRPLAPHVVRCGPGGIKDGRRIGAVRREVLKSRTIAVGGGDPPGRRPHADPDPVVLADDQQRNRQADVGTPTGRVHRADRGGVVHRRIAGTGHGDGVGRPRRRHPELAGPFDGERDTDRPRQVGGDRRGLGDHGEFVSSENLVPPTGNRLVSRRCHPGQNIPHRVDTRDLPGATDVEPTGAVVQQGRVGRSQRRRDRRVRLVSRRADGVEAAPGLLHPSGGQIQLPTGGLRVEDGQRLAHGQRGSWPDRRARLGRKLRAGNRSQFAQRRIDGGGCLVRVSSSLSSLRAVRGATRDVRYSRKSRSATNSATSICAFCSRPE